METLNHKQLRKDIHQALRAWHQTEGKLRNLLDYLLLVRIQREETVAPSRRLATNMVLEKGIALLKERDSQAEIVLRARFQDRKIAQKVANLLNCSIDHVNRLQRNAIEQLSAILYEEELAARAAWIAKWESKLPVATYSRLSGGDDVVNLIVEQLVDKHEQVNVVALCGIGGIGKTTLAHAATVHLIHTAAFESYIWIRVDPNELTQKDVSADDIVDYVIGKLADELNLEQRHDLRQHVQHALNKKPYLVVLDNFESFADISLLLQHLLSWGDLSKFLLTTRARPINTSETFIVALRELSELQSADLIRNHAKTIHLPELAEATDDQIAPIYEAVGGNPLALKLVVSLAAIMPLPRILQDLTQRKQDEIEAMYRHIYFQTWTVLSENAKNLLQGMVLVTDSGGTVEHLQRISRLDEELFWASISELVSRSLLEVRGTAWERRYGCHRLTRTFLRRDILGWDDA